MRLTGYKNIVPYSLQRAHNYDYRIIFLLIFVSFFMVYNLWNGSLYPWDEGWYGEIAREIVIDKLGWLTLHYNNNTFFQKPPLFIWMIAGAFKTFGVNEFSVRFWSALLGFGCIFLLYFFTKNIFLSKNLAFFSSLTLLGFTFFYRQARMGMMDVPLAFLVLLGVFLFWIGRKKQSYLFFVGPVIAIAFMIKSFAAFQLPLILLLFSIISGEKRLLINTKFILGISVGIVICLPWHIHQYIKYGSHFIKEYFFVHIVQRATEVFEDQTPKSLFFYFKFLLIEFPLGKIQVMTVPLFFFITLTEKDKQRKKALLIVAAGILAIIILFTIVKTKLSWYIVPIYPFLSIATVLSIDHIFSKVQKNKSRFVAIVLTILIIIPIARLFFYQEYRLLDFRPELKNICTHARNEIKENDVLLFYKIKDETTALFYCEKKMIRVSKEQLKNFINSPKPIVCLMSKEDEFYKEIKREIYGISILSETNNFLLIKNS